MAGENQINQGPAVSPQAGATREQNRRQQTGSRVAEREHGVGNSGTQPTENSNPTALVPGGEVWNDAKQRLQTLKQDTDDYVRKNPAKAVFTALGIGFVLGLIRRR